MGKRYADKELQALHNTEFFSIKSAATEKTDALLAEIRDAVAGEIKRMRVAFPKEVDASMGKIFRGENYRGLPYLVLDFPKHFSKNSVHAFRTMFWWGNFFSCTLHLQGKALEEKRNALLNRVPALKKKGVYLCVNNTPWEYHYQKDNYTLLDKIPPARLKKMILSSEFIKLSRKISINEYAKLPVFAQETFRMFYGK